MTQKRRLIRELPTEEQPMTRLAQLGPEAVSTAELLALFLWMPDGLDVATEMLVKFGSLRDLITAPVNQLCEISGIGERGAMRLRAIVELSKRVSKTCMVDKSKITSPADAANLLMEDMRCLKQEEMRVIILDTRNQVLGVKTIYKGSLNTAVVRIGEVLRPAIEANAAAIIISHNHPSGDPSPSPEDINVTRQIVEAGKLMNIEVLDHVIIGDGRFTSLKERGLGFN